MADLYRKAKSIAICEGYYVDGSLAQRNNNPGNIKLPNTYRDKQGHTIFPSPVHGWLALYSLITGRYADRTPLEMNRMGYAIDQNWHRCVNYYYYGKV